VATSDLARFSPRAALALARTIPLGLVILFDELPNSSAIMSSLKLRELATSCIARKGLSSLSELDTKHASREVNHSDRFRVCLPFYRASCGLEDADWLVTGQLAVSQMPPKERKLSTQSRRWHPRVVQ